MKINIFILLFAFAWNSCSHYDVVDTGPLQTESVEIADAEVEEENLSDDSDHSKSGKKHLSLQYKQKHYDHWLKYFSGKNKERFLRQLKNGDKYRDIVHAVFKKHGLPEDLFYVGLIESGFYTHARSHAAAVGPWQFIRGTGKRYGLKINRNVDERRSIYKATESAAQYFKDLYNIFGSWDLALCAYNAGEYRIINAIRKGNTRDYKALVKKKLIPKETIFYVPKVAVARYLDKKWKRTIDDKDRNFYNNVEFLKIQRTVNVAKVAKNIGVSWKTLKRLNSDLNSYWLRPGRRGFDLYIPAEKKQVAISYLKSLGYTVKKYVVKKKSNKHHRSPAGRSRYYRVRRGDNLTGIAKKFGTTVRRLKKQNRLRSGKIFVGQKLGVSRGQLKRKHYRVRRGDNLTGIAKKFGTTVHRLKRQNRLRSGKIFVGQNLKVSRSQSSKHYRVRRGDNLTEIAQNFGTTVHRLKKKNGLRSGRIMVGQKLRIPASKDRKYYVVKRGDNLTRIAQRFGVSIAHILRVNQLKNEIIYPRQKIIIPSG